MRTIGPGLRRAVTLVPLSGEGDLPRPIYSMVINALGAKWSLFGIFGIILYIRLICLLDKTAKRCRNFELIMVVRFFNNNCIYSI